MVPPFGLNKAERALGRLRSKWNAASYSFGCLESVAVRRNPIVYCRSKTKRLEGSRGTRPQRRCQNGLFADPTIARITVLIRKVLKNGPASTAQLYRAMVTEFAHDKKVSSFSQAQILRLLQEMERSGSVRGSVDSGQENLVWELAKSDR